MFVVASFQLAARREPNGRACQDEAERSPDAPSNNHRIGVGRIGPPQRPGFMLPKVHLRSDGKSSEKWSISVRDRY